MYQASVDLSRTVSSLREAEKVSRRMVRSPRQPRLIGAEHRTTNEEIFQDGVKPF
jgi:hypothetical protein